MASFLCSCQKAGYRYAVSAAPRNFISVAAFGARAEPPFFRNSAAISSKDFPLVSGTLKNVNRVKAKTTPAKRKNTYGPQKSCMENKQSPHQQLAHLLFSECAQWQLLTAMYGKHRATMKLQVQLQKAAIAKAAGRGP